MPWDLIGMDKKTWEYVQKEACKKGYPKLTATPVKKRDLFAPEQYLFVSGAPQNVIWGIITQRRKQGDGSYADG